MATRATEDAPVESFAEALHGDLIRPGDDPYDDARAVWTGMIDKRPALIARPAGAADVIEAVDFARSYEREFVTTFAPDSGWWNVV